MKDEILKAGLLGTDRYMPEFALPFSEIMQKIADDNPEKEDVFLKQSALFYALNDVCLPLEPSDYSSSDFLEIEETHDSLEQILERALENDNHVLIEYCLQFVDQKSLRIPRYVLPDLIEKYKKNRWLTVILKNAGDVGKELVKMMQLDLDNKIDLSQDIGAFEDIINWAKQIRQTEPEQIWTKEIILNDEGAFVESGQSKFERLMDLQKVERRLILLDILKIGLSSSDEAFLTKLLKTKSQQIKNAVIQLLIQIENSPMRKEFEAIIEKLFVVSIKKEFLGLSKKTVVEINANFTFNKEYLALGFDEVSAVKEVSDISYMAAQCIRKCPMNLFSKVLNIDNALFLEYFYHKQKEEILKSACAINAINFGETAFLIEVAKQQKEVHYLVNLPFDEALKNFEAFYRICNSREVTNTLLNWLFKQPYFELSAPIAQNVLQDLKNNPYDLQGKQLYHLGLYFPESMRDYIVALNKTSNVNYFHDSNYLIVQAIEDKNELINL